MKREELLKLFPSLVAEEIQDLPEELVVCWYPSSGNHFDAAFDWQRQNTKLVPNLFIYSDNSDFEIPADAQVCCSATVESVDLRSKIVKESTEEEEKKTWDGTLLEGLDYIFFDQPEAKEPEYFRGIVHLTLMKYEEKWFFLINTENEYLYLSFLEHQIIVDCLYVNRPCDSFLSDRGPNPDQVHFIDISRIGVSTFISGKNNGIRLPLSEEYKIISEFDINNPHFEGDIGQIYSRFG